MVSDVSVLEVVFVLLLNKRKTKKYDKKEREKNEKGSEQPYQYLPADILISHL